MFLWGFSISAKHSEEQEVKVDGAFPYGDIIVIAAVAAFILLRYRAMLGEKSGRDVEATRIRPEDLEPVIQLPERDANRKKEIKKALIEEPAQFADQFSAMRAIDAQFSADEFLGGAKAAYEMVLDAYNEGDHETLKMLLSDSIYQEFRSSLDANEKEGRKAHTTLVAIVKADITDATLQGNKAVITVDFLSEQIPLVRDKDGVIVEGNASTQDAVEDQWVFERTLTNADPAWKIVET